ncbi:N-terminal acetyltransferase [Blyttiomyces helicus]|uniref:N-terminal acetyltransferase n=1 Tax=Blyttiomyces helicus TaxID=388810 RepID=A0A4P9WQ54_9FUNG|nr:N-terminal acetyltransferase [Blyttiomyces helicus]|eukprot:RKO94712.1 N-terminal acetyltransferase [Blyttiomyces helicus]
MSCQTVQPDSGLQIRKAILSDAGNMDLLNRKILPENYPMSDWLFVLGKYPSYSFVAYDEDKLVGYVLGLVVSNEGLIASLAVDKDYRRRHIAECLMGQSLSELKKTFHNVKLNVRVGNTPAQNLYTKFGFTKSKCEKSYYQDGEDGYEMILAF